MYNSERFMKINGFLVKLELWLLGLRVHSLCAKTCTDTMGGNQSSEVWLEIV